MQVYQVAYNQIGVHVCTVRMSIARGYHVCYAQNIFPDSEGPWNTWACYMCMLIFGFTSRRRAHWCLSSTMQCDADRGLLPSNSTHRNMFLDGNMFLIWLLAGLYAFVCMSHVFLSVMVAWFTYIQGVGQYVDRSEGRGVNVSYILINNIKSQFVDLSFFWAGSDLPHGVTK